MSFVLLVLFCCYTLYVCNEAMSYSYGRLYFDVQANKVLRDPQDLLRMKLARPENEVTREYAAMDIELYPPCERKAVVEEFLKNNFVNESGLEHWKPRDCKSRPDFFTGIKNSEVLKLLSALNSLWTKHGRKLTDDVYNNSSLYTFIDVPKPFFVSCKNGKEFSYWESYWIFQGLMACDMLESSRCILENILSLVKRMGYCPEYNRVYCKENLSPPLLPLMMDAYANKTGDVEFVKMHLDTLDSEFSEWIEKRVSVLMSPFHVFVVATESLVEEGFEVKEEPGPKELFWTLMEGANLVSVRLNAVTEWSARVLSKWMREFGHIGRARELESTSNQFAHTLNTLLKFGDCWRDLNLEHGFEEENLNNRWPLWSGLAVTGCTSSNLMPATGPEALLSSHPYSLEWLSSLPNHPNNWNLEDSAAALAIASRDTSALSRLRLRPKGKPTKTKGISYLMLLVSFLAWRVFDTLAVWNSSPYVMARRRRRAAREKLSS